jgi:hypothetical protein
VLCYYSMSSLKMVTPSHHGKCFVSGLTLLFLATLPCPALRHAMAERRERGREREREREGERERERMRKGSAARRWCREVR